MRQISSKLNIYVKSVSMINNNIERLMLNIIFWSFGVLVFFYILFLGNMVKNIIERRHLETETRVLSSEVGDLELTYLSMSNNIDLNLSYSMGFKETKASFATRKSLGFKSSSETLDSVKMSQNDI